MRACGFIALQTPSTPFGSYALLVMAVALPTSSSSSGKGATCARELVSSPHTPYLEWVDQAGQWDERDKLTESG
ncbi:hypothetical protein B0I35DRAFT_66282 [Stachybotrys elegans]|uniref:Uncharacterized protein n=1 Tax=Stachybotrys elegans TaxID=80388 RepID=A0A8K0WP77_9HYPO|nr:hypothetical protein B0I35DRAFT_66282 [Stachybotrys elegans]